MHLIQAEVLSDMKTDISAMGKDSKLTKRTTSTKFQVGLEVMEKSVASLIRAPPAALEDDEEDNGVSLYHPAKNLSTSSVEHSDAGSMANRIRQGANLAAKFSATFMGQSHTGTGDQINGGLIEGQRVVAIPDTSNVLWDSNAKPFDTKGDQVNGLRILCDSERIEDRTGMDFSHLKIQGHFVGNRASGLGNQINGFHIQKQKEKSKEEESAYLEDFIGV
ncbi:uncharacterized protein PAC_16325 [Phialocephala subalpina]|uniref:Uncharacterized protein n=1 Tax=Phialocephala subalpina TaxID=576137 RepID=A0A1L7XN37_9HELO|nr:uncharacterized protein PAC_16325 [Phialocephala subalpina]